METITITFPAYIAALPKKEQGRARMRFLMRLAAILCTESASINALSKRIGFHHNSLNSMFSQGTLDNGIPVNIIKAIEQVIGVGVIPREMLNPEVYGPAEL